jgi:capsular polysaccharide biosynthesis protein
MIRNTNVVVGVHGAGLMFIMFAAEEAVLVEIHPSYRQDRHFRHASRMTGKIYMPMRTTIRETCQGSSDNVMVDVGEFEKAMDGALRAARSLTFTDIFSVLTYFCLEILMMG